MSDAAEALQRVVREEWGRLVTLLLAHFRRLDLVEDALGDAVEAAARTWPSDGVPTNPSGWLVTTARRRVLDRMRAETMASRKMPLLVVDADRSTSGPMVDPGGLVEDDLLRLVLMCSHPALDPQAAAALALRLVLGVSTFDIARLFLVAEPTMAARITRAKKKIVAAGIPFTVPGTERLADRLDGVAHVAYLAFTAGYAPASGPDPVRAELAGEAVRLVRVVREASGHDPGLTALLALVLLQHSRRDARTDDHGGLVLLQDQDRSRWHRNEIGEALELLNDQALAQPLSATAASYLLQARIAAEHALADEPLATRWDRILALYDALLQVTPGPAVELARAVALAEIAGPDAGLAALRDIDVPGHRVEAVRGELFARKGWNAAARSSFTRALALGANDAERAYLAKRVAEVEQLGRG